MNEQDLISLASQKAVGKAKDQAEVPVLTLRYLASYSRVAKDTVLIYALQVYKDGLWTPHPLYGKDWRAWIKHSIGKIVTPNERSIITNGVPVLEYLRRNPIRVKDAVINHTTFLRGAKGNAI